jgi:hypothetical protein
MAILITIIATISSLISRLTIIHVDFTIIPNITIITNLITITIITTVTILIMKQVNISWTIFRWYSIDGGTI